MAKKYMSNRRDYKVTDRESGLVSYKLTRKVQNVDMRVHLIERMSDRKQKHTTKRYE